MLVSTRGACEEPGMDRLIGFVMSIGFRLAHRLHRADRLCGVYSVYSLGYLMLPFVFRTWSVNIPRKLQDPSGLAGPISSKTHQAAAQ